MKKLTLILALLLTACGDVTPPTPQYDVVLKNDETGNTNYGPAKDDLERCDLLRAAIKAAKDADSILLGAATFDCDGKNKGTVQFPNGISVVGMGADKTNLYSNVYSDGQGLAFEVKNGTFQNLSFNNQTWQIHEDGRTIGFYEGLKKTDDGVNYANDASGHHIVEDAAPGPYTATFNNVTFIGNAWVVYSWDGRGHHWIIKNSKVISGRQGISLMSGGGYFDSAEISDTVFDIDTMRSQDVGWTSNQNVGGGYGLVVRGGHTTCKDCVFNMKCGITPHPASFVPRCVPIFDGDGFGSASSPWTYLTITRPVFNVDGRGSKDVYDLFFSNQGAKDKLQLIEMPANYTKNW